MEQLKEQERKEQELKERQQQQLANLLQLLKQQKEQDEQEKELSSRTENLREQQMRIQVLRCFCIFKNSFHIVFLSGLI